MNKDDFERLDKIQTKFNEWLRYTEAKNGVLLAVVGTSFFGVIKILEESKDLSYLTHIYACSFFSFSLLAFVVALISFVPRLKAPYWVKFKGVTEKDNPFYFADACNYSENEYLKMLGVSCTSTSKIEEKMAAQIIVVSRIVVLKNSYFTLAIWLFVSALLTPFLAFFFWAYRS